MPLQETGPEPIPQPSNPVGYGTWVNKVWIPKDGDAGQEATWLGITDLVNRTTWLAWRCIDIRNGGVYANAAIQFNGPLIFGDSSWPLLDPVRSWERHSLRLHTTGRAATDTSDTTANLADAWITTEGGFRAIQTRQTASTSRYHEIELPDMPDGGALTNMAVISQGVSQSDFVVLAKYRLGRYQGSDAIEWLSADTDDNHTDGNYTTEQTTTFAPTGATHTVDKSYIYVLRVTHPSKSGGLAGNDLYIKDVKYSGTAAQLGL